MQLDNGKVTDEEKITVLEIKDWGMIIFKIIGIILLLANIIILHVMIFGGEASGFAALKFIFQFLPVDFGFLVILSIFMYIRTSRRRLQELGGSTTFENIQPISKMKTEGDEPADEEKK